MAKAIFFNIPASGHVNPSLPLTTELVQRGETVIYYLTEGYRAKVEATGATFRAYPNLSDSYFEDAGLDGSNPPLTAKTMITTSQQMLPALLDMLRQEKPDYILYDSMCPWAALAGRILQIPSVSSQGLLVVRIADLLRWSMLRMVVSTVIKGMPTIRQYNKTMGEIAKEYHIKPLQLTDVFNAPADLTLCYTSAHFQPGGEKLKKRIAFVGPGI
ncbi:MAG: hypothetical protein H7Y09_09865, partial [Chitinophagaceae bacterium]|nr:hypothetical protein [Anaerolineae bacterium]